jgi:zinc/manganese transport system permease protein
MLQYDFMQNAFAASGVVALVSGVVGYFLVLRGQAFAGHALSHVGFAGATAGLLIGLAPLWGLIGLSVAAGAGMGFLGERIAGRDVAIGVVLALALAVGLLCLHFYTGYASQATALLFGNVLGVDPGTLWALAGLGVVTLVLMAATGRPLLFASLHPELAEAKGVPVRLVSVLFLAVVGLAVAGCSQIVGVLLVFALMVGPAAAAQALSARVATGVALSTLLAFAEAWGGIALAYETDWPSSFWITALSAGVYVVSVGGRDIRSRVASAN